MFSLGVEARVYGGSTRTEVNLGVSMVEKKVVLYVGSTRKETTLGVFSGVEDRCTWNFTRIGTTSGGLFWGEKRPLYMGVPLG